jgi:hypothetical protein
MRGRYWINLAQDRWWASVNAVMSLRVPYNERNFTIRTMLHGGSDYCGKPFAGHGSKSELKSSTLGQAYMY